MGGEARPIVDKAHHNSCKKMVLMVVWVMFSAEGDHNPMTRPQIGNKHSLFAEQNQKRLLMFAAKTLVSSEL